jgi:cytochrome c oxidase subunit 3
VTLGAAYGALAGGVLVWGLLVSRLRAKSWQTKGAEGAINEGGGTQLSPNRIGLITFLAVITSLFGLFIAAYHIRMMDGIAQGDWVHFPIPRILWANTAILMLGSIAMQWARAAADSGTTVALRGRLITGGLFTGAFLVGQVLAWRELADTPFLSASNPAIAFFYLLTAVHGLHVLGGLAVWARTLIKMFAPVPTAVDVRQIVSLCTIYWHYLLLVWLVLFGLMLST